MLEVWGGLFYFFGACKGRKELGDVCNMSLSGALERGRPIKVHYDLAGAVLSVLAKEKFCSLVLIREIPSLDWQGTEEC